MNRTRVLGCALAVVVCPTTTRAAAGPDRPLPPTMAPTVVPTAVEEARASFAAAVALYAAGDYSAALDQFERAYLLAPTYQILFNLAQVAYQQRDYALALRYFTQYLDEGGAAIKLERRAEVERERARLRLRMGFAAIVSLPPAIVSSSAVVSLPRPTSPASGVPYDRPSAASPSRSSWVLPGILSAATAGAAVTAVLTGRRALNLSNQLQHDLNDYPVSREHLDQVHDDQRHWALATDGALLATAILGSLALYAITVRFSSTGP